MSDEPQDPEEELIDATTELAQEITSLATADETEFKSLTSNLTHEFLGAGISSQLRGEEIVVRGEGIEIIINAHLEIIQFVVDGHSHPEIIEVVNRAIGEATNLQTQIKFRQMQGLLGAITNQSRSTEGGNPPVQEE
jgi:hypothetical protein